MKITADRPKLEITRDGETRSWEYDVVVLKIEIEALEQKHNMKGDGLTAAPTKGFLQDFSDVLVRYGLEESNADVAHRLYNVIVVQFNTMAAQLAQQVAAIE